MKEATGQRGKAAEKEVEAVFKRWNEQIGFAYHRLADSRSARNFLAANPADFIYCWDGNMGFVEVKSVAHDYRVPLKNISQLPVLKKFADAGARSMILIKHTTTGQWRVVRPGKMPSDTPSWDLRTVESFTTAEEAILSMGRFWEVLK